MKTILLFVFSLLTGCATQFRTHPNQAAALTSSDADIYEAVFRHQFASNASAAQRSAGTYFIQIQDADPDEAFLRRFSDHTPAVKPASQARIGRHSTVYDRQTRNESLIFRLGPIRWHSKISAEVDGGYYEANLSSSSNTYRLARQGNNWTVIKDTVNWISHSRTSSPRSLYRFPLDGLGLRPEEAGRASARSESPTAGSSEARSASRGTDGGHFLAAANQAIASKVAIERPRGPGR